MKSKIISLVENKKNIFFISSYSENYIVNVLKTLQVEKIYFYTDCKEVSDIILNNEMDKLGDERYQFLICNHTKSTNGHILLKLMHQYSKKNLMGLSKSDIGELYMNYYINYFKDRNIDTDNDKIRIKNYIITNFLHDRSFKIQIGDSILPSLYSDLSMVEEGSFEYEEASLCEKDVVIDCGAYVGSFSVIALSKGCSVHAFEPMPRTIEILQKNLSNYDSSKYHICDYALSDKPCVAEFTIPYNRDSGISMILKNEQDKKINFPVTTLDKYVEENDISKVDFIKADIEGAERYMLMGATNTIRKYNPKLSICTYHLEDDPKVLEDIILSFNSKYIIKHKWMKLYAYIPVK